MSVRLLVLLCSLLILCISSCAGPSSLPETSFQDDLSQKPDGPAGVDDGLQAGLPALSSLDDAGRAVSVQGPGWHLIDATAAGATTLKALVFEEDGNLALNGDSGLSYAIYPVSGFGSDAFPTSMRLATADNPLEQYYVLAADFMGGRWQVLGPFTDDATVEFPGLVEAGATRRYLSEAGICYVGLLVVPGGKYVFSSIELGVDGGGSGPRPPAFLDAQGSASAIGFSWAPSPDEADPDFDGYLLDRAPQLFGDYEPLGSGRVSGTSYIDDTIQPLNAYRYRLAAVDTSGNRSPWVLFTAHSSNSGKLNPVIVADVPQGPLYGPVNLEIDFGTDSYDPEGSEITGYYIASPEIGLISAADGKAGLFLQPGCHFLQFTIQTMDGRIATTIRTIRILPQWEAEPQLVLPGPAATTTPRILYPSGLFGLYGLPVLCGYDQTSQSVVLWNQRFGSEPYLDSLPAYWPVSAMTKAHYILDGVTAAAIMNGHIWLAVFDFDGHHWVQGPATPSIHAVDIAGNSSSSRYLLHSFPGSVSEDLVATPLDNLQEHITVATDIGDIIYITSVLDESDFTTHVFVQTTTQVIWYQLDGFMNVLDTSTVGNFLNSHLQCCIEPLSGRPMLMTYDTWYRWTLQDELGGWPAMQNIDDTETNRFGGALEAIDRACAAFAYSSGQARVYAFNGTGWDVRNVLDHSTDSGWPLAMTDAQVNGSTLDLYDGTYDGETRALRVRGDGTSEVVASLPRSAGQGSSMHAVNSGTEIHMNWFDRQANIDRYCHSSDDGASWSMPADLPSNYWTCGTNSLGQIYYSGRSGPLNLLMYWNGAGLVEQSNGLSGGNTYEPMLARRSFTDDTYWMRFDKNIPECWVVRGHFDTGMPATDYSQLAFGSDLDRIWDGAANVLGNTPQLLVLTGGFNRAEAGLAIQDGLSGSYDMLIPQLNQTDMKLHDQQLVRGRGLATCSFLGPQLYLLDQAFFSTYSTDERAMRHVVSHDGIPATGFIDMQYEPFSRDARRTVSADTAPSYTGVALISDIEGREVKLSWSNFGEWEALPVPQRLMGKSMHELVIGPDGRWRVFYRDRMTDEVWMLSTLKP